MVGQVADQVAGGITGKNVEDGFELPREDAAAAKREFVATCMTWPDDFVGCMADGDFESERCVAAYAAKEGLVVAGEGKPGPEARSRALGDDAALRCQADRCAIVRMGRVEDLAGQTIAPGSLAGLVGGTWFVASDEVNPPVVSDGGELVLFQDGRVRRRAAAPCDDCWQETPWKLPLGIGFAPELHRLGDRLLYSQIGSLRLFAADGSVVFALDHADLGEPNIGARHVDVGIGDAACTLDLDRCTSDQRRPRFEAAHAEQLGGVPPCATCVKAEHPGTKPTRLDDAVYFVEGGRVFAVSGGRRSWTVEVDADAVLAVPGALLVASYWTADHPARLLLLDPTSGAVRLTMEVPSRMSITPVALGRDRDTVLMVTNDTLFTWELDALKAAL